MMRTLKPSRGAYAVLGVVMFFPILLGLIVSFAHGHIPSQHILIEDSKALGCMGAIILPIAWMMSRNSIVVTDTEIIGRSSFGRPVRVRFSDIAESLPKVFTQRNHPTRLIIVFTDESKQPVTLFLTKFQSQDVAWLLSLEALKVRR